MHHSAIRIHLNKLEEAGLIVSRKLHHRGVVGRPQLAFLPNPKALSITLPVRNYEMLADLLLDWTRRADVDSELAGSPEEFAAEWGRNLIRTRGRLADGPLPFGEAVGVLVEELQLLGGAPQNLQMNGGSAAFFSTNCPFLELAERHQPLVCSVHRGVSRGMLSELVGQPVIWRQGATLAQGDEACTNHLALAVGAA
jgi:predicted ArsR family transcriptional regulator